MDAEMQPQLVLSEWWRYAAWARGQLASRLAALDDAALSRPFAMGWGSLRATLQHVYGADRVWAERIGMPGTAELPKSDTLATPAAIGAAHVRLDEFRANWPAACDPVALAAPVEYANSRGERFQNTLGDILLHVANHEIHHRAQISNMLRQFGAAPVTPGLDYIFFQLAQPGGGTAAGEAPQLDLPTLRRLFAYSDWACDRVHAHARSLPDAALDQPFEIGVGSLRATLLHVRFAEHWWLQNWTEGPDRPFPELPVGTPIAELDGLWKETRARRNQLLAGMNTADLTQRLTARPRPGVERVFPIGVVLLQLCGHGTHHRAQAQNMLRQVGAKPGDLDYILWRRSVV